MNFNWLNNPNNLWGKWVQYRPKQQYLALSGIFLLCLLPYGNTLLENLHQRQQIEQELGEIQHKLNHQKQIHSTLQQKVETTTLSPTLTKQIQPINHKIRQFNSRAEIQQEWQMTQPAKLQLQAEFSFVNFIEFFTALLQDFPSLELISVQMEKAEKGIKSSMLFQLQPQEEIK